MKLRRQLLLVSLLTLSLPWAGCQYIQEMESALRQGQSAALLASAQAVAARLGSEPELLLPAYSDTAEVPLARELYGHPLTAPAIVDGYDDDWRGQRLAPRYFQFPQQSSQFSESSREQLANQPGEPFLEQSDEQSHKQSPDVSIQSQPLSSGAQAVAIRSGIYGAKLYLYIDVDDDRISYHHPGRATLASGDHLLLARGRRDTPPLVYKLRTSAPGSISAVTHNSRGRLYQEHRIKGYWRERSGGYQVELELPLAFAERGFGVSVVDRDEGRPEQLSGSYLPARLPSRQLDERESGLGRLITPRQDVAREIGIFSRAGLQLRVVDRHAWQLATAGSLEVEDSGAERPHWLLSSFYRAILKSSELPPHPDHRSLGRYDYREVEQALTGEAATHWYQLANRQLGSVAVPIRRSSRTTDTGDSRGSQLLGVVIAEQTSDALLDLTNSAFTRLVLLSMGAALVAGLGLLGYASWLSWRIRRLSLAADRAVASDGQIADVEQLWPVSRAGDELGELSRSYRSLLLRLQAYTDYLKTLADKLSHELRTPLAVVRSSLDNLEHEALPEQAAVYTERAKTGAERLSRLLTAMSEASRVEASIQRAEREVFALDELLRHVCSAYRDVYLDQRIELSIANDNKAAGNKHYDYWGSPDLLVQCLDKLVDNAVDYAQAETVIVIELFSTGAHWQLRVSNRGPLLPVSMREQLFDSLVSLREADKKQKQGKTHMGLGLHIVRLVSQFHGGSVRAENLADDSGVVFSLSLPKTPSR